MTEKNNGLRPITEGYQPSDCIGIEGYQPSIDAKPTVPSGGSNVTKAASSSPTPDSSDKNK